MSRSSYNDNVKFEQRWNNVDNTNHEQREFNFSEVEFVLVDSFLKIILKGEMDRDISVSLSLDKAGKKPIPIPFLRIGNKRIRLHLEVQDSDDKLDEWFIENTLDKVGLKLRSIWVHPWNLRRPIDGEFVRICVPLRNYPEKFYKYFRMGVSTFHYILDNIKCSITKRSRRAPVGPAERLAVTLR